MADVKLTALSAIAGLDAADVVHVVDVSDLTDGPSGTSKKMTVQQVLDLTEKDAANLTFTPAGDIAATDVQAAIVEVRDDTDTKLATKAASSHTHTASDVTDFDTEVTNNATVSQLVSDVAALDAAVVLQGTWDASAGTFPGSGTAQAGASWIVSTGGTVGGEVFTANDRIVAITDNASTTVYASNWHKLDYTDQVLSVNGETGAVTGFLKNLSEDTTPQLGGELDCGANSIGFTMQTATGDGSTTVDWGNGNHMDFTFGAFNETFTFTAPAKPGVYTMSLKQDSVGSRTATWPATVKWPGGTAPTLTTTATTGYDIISFRYDGTNYYATSTLDFS